MPAVEITELFINGVNYVERKTERSKISVRIALKSRTTVSFFSTSIIKRTKKNSNAYKLFPRITAPKNHLIKARAENLIKSPVLTPKDTPDYPCQSGYLQERFNHNIWACANFKQREPYECQSSPLKFEPPKN